nr:PAAR-like protein [Mucilaginibacter sp. L294]
MGKEYYINDKTFASCTNGVLPGRMKIISANRTVNNKGFKMANTDDRFTPFSCKYAILLAVLAAVFIAALSFVAAFLIGLIIGIGICAIATYAQKWKNFHPKVIVQGKNALTDKSFIDCPIGGVVTPTFSPLVASLRAGVNFASTVLDAFLIYIGGQGAVQIFKNYTLKIALGYTATNFAVNLATDKYVTQPVSKKITGEDPAASDVAGKTKEYGGYLGDGTPFWEKGADGQYVSRNAGDYDNFTSINSDADAARTSSANQAAQAARQNTTGQAAGDRAYNSEVQRQNTQINADERVARGQYKDMYKRMAQMEGESGKAADKQARSQAMQAARRDANVRKAQAQQDATRLREQAIEQAKTNAENQARTNTMNNTAAYRESQARYLAKAGWGFLKSWGVGVAIGVVNNVANNKANKAINDHAEQWQNEVIQKLGLNVVALEK